MRVAQKTDTVRRHKPKGRDKLFHPTERRAFTYVDDGLSEPVVVPRVYATTYWEDDIRKHQVKVDLDKVHVVSPNYSLWPYRGSDLFSKANRYAHNAALRRFIDNVEVHQSMYEDIHERQQSIDLTVKVAQRTLRLIKAVGAARKGNFKKLKNFLRGKPVHFRKQIEKAWKNRSKLPEGWLEYRFGIVPLVGSINTLATALSKDLPIGRVRGSGSASDSYDTKSDKVIWGYRTISGRQIQVNVKCRITAYVVGINPHKSLAALTGIYAPLSSAWSIVPWGWAVDYFANVGELISNLEPRFPGVSLAGEYTTYRRFADGQHFDEVKSAGLPFNVGFDGYPRNYSFHAQYFENERLPGASYQFSPEFSAELSFGRLSNLLSAVYLTIKGR